MILVFIVLIYLLVIFFGKKSSARHREDLERTVREQEAKQQAAFGVRPSRVSGAAPSAARATSPRPAAAANPAASYSARNAQALKDFDTVHYHPEGYDFETCFSFKDVPPGVDELSALIRANSRHERELEKLMHSSENPN